MPLEKPILERQLQNAEQAFVAWKNVLNEKGVAADQFRRDPKWRRLKSTCSQIRRRLNSKEAIILRDEEVKRRKVEKASQVEDEPTPKKKQKASKGDGKKKQKAKK